MGTMRKMEDPPMEEKPIAAVRIVKSETKLLGNSKVSSNVPRSKRIAEKLRRRDGNISNGNRSLRQRLDACCNCETTEVSDERYPLKNANAMDDKHQTDHQEGDVPMDLSKRSLEEEPTQKDMDVTVRNGKQQLSIGNDAGSTIDVCRYQEVTEEPLNLSRHGNALSHCVTTGRWNSCPRLSNHPTASSISPNTTTVSGSTNLLQKRVRLEEMVSYIRRYSVVDSGRNRSSATVGGVATVVASYRDGESTYEVSELEDEDVVEEGVVEIEANRVVPRAVKRSMSCSSLETTSTSASHRRKNATPYRGSTPPSKRARSIHPPVGEDVPKDLRTSGVPNGGSTGGFISYPVLRQQLLGVDCRQLGLLQSVTSKNLTKDRGNKYDEVSSEMEASEAKKKPDDDQVVEEDDDDEGVDGGAFLRRQMRLLSTSGTAPARLPWTAYAYYANLFQELQGSLTSSMSPTSAMSLPLSLSLPLAIPASENRAESPLSEDSDDDDCNASSLTSGTATTVGSNIAAACSNVMATGDGSANSTSAMFRKRAPRALTGKHVKHGTGASPATLLTLRQKIEQKRIQQQQIQHRLQTSNAATRLERRAVAAITTENHSIMHKSLKGSAAATILKKKKAVS